MKSIGIYILEALDFPSPIYVTCDKSIFPLKLLTFIRSILISSNHNK
jgi:hypothetical protein